MLTFFCVMMVCAFLAIPLAMWLMFRNEPADILDYKKYPGASGQ